ncbi:WD40-repeat-containing domain protein [Rhizoctonia solani]|nr:WD40-repeat-containing domain protein [Rhizoctonia solani]
MSKMKIVVRTVVSPNGILVASGLDIDATPISVYDADTSITVASCFEGRNASNTSITFPPDGICVASTSQHGVICIWDIQNGKLKFKPLQGHGESATPIAFPPDGIKFATGSKDNTVRISSAADGSLITGPLEHED